MLLAPAALVASAEIVNAVADVLDEANIPNVFWYALFSVIVLFCIILFCAPLVGEA